MTLGPYALAGSMFDSVNVDRIFNMASWKIPSIFRGLKTKAVQFGNVTGFYDHANGMDPDRL